MVDRQFPQDIRKDAFPPPPAEAEPPAKPKPRRMARRWTVLLVVAGVIVLTVSTTLVLKKHWVRVRMFFVPDMYALPVDSTGYCIEPVPVAFRSSFVRGHDVYLYGVDGQLYKGDDRDDAGGFRVIGNGRGLTSKLAFVSSAGTLFLSKTPVMHAHQVLRSVDGGLTWEPSLDCSVWRMEEDEATHTLWAGDYSGKKDPVFHATLYRSTDEGKTWERIFDYPGLDHIHTVKYDPLWHRIYLAAGDRPAQRGQAFSDDGGKTWQWIKAGPKEGHTDVALTANHVIWGSDDQMGRILIAPRDKVTEGQEALWGHRQQVWFVISDEQRQVYAGTFGVPMSNNNDNGSFLLASSDEGKTWQNLMFFQKTGGSSAFRGESRRLSQDGWLYFTTSGGKGYRVRKVPSET